MFFDVVVVPLPPLYVLLLVAGHDRFCKRKNGGALHCVVPVLLSEGDGVTMSQSTSEDLQPTESLLGTMFRALSQDAGVHQENLFGPELPALWHIADEDDEWIVCVTVVRQRERLIERIQGQ